MIVHRLIQSDLNSIVILSMELKIIEFIIIKNQDVTVI